MTAAGIAAARIGKSTVIRESSARPSPIVNPASPSALISSTSGPAK